MLRRMFDGVVYVMFDKCLFERWVTLDRALGYPMDNTTLGHVHVIDEELHLLLCDGGGTFERRI